MAQDTRLFLRTPSSARERAVFSPGKDGEAGDVGYIVDTAGRSQAEKGPLEARSSFQTEPNKALQDLAQQVGIVRRWLMMTALLKSTVLGLGFVVACITLFALLDHWCHFQSGARILSLILFTVACVAIGVRLATKLKTQASFSHAAEYIESQQRFYRQLVTAMEYYENRRHYPYSQSLAHLLIRRMLKKTQDLDFRGFVNRWHTLGWAAGMLVALVVVVLFALDNYHFFNRQVLHLVSPTAAAGPVHRPELTSVTKDILCEPNTIVKFAARLDSRSPDSIKWILTREDGITGGQALPQSEERTIRPSPQVNGTTLFEHRKFFERTGTFAYYFQGPQGDTDIFTVTVSEPPQVKTLQTRIRASGRAVAEPNDGAWEGVTDHRIEVIAGSQVSFAVQASQGAERVHIHGPDGQTETIALQGQDQFTWTCEARTNGSVRFNMVNRRGQTKGTPVAIVVKPDQPPRFEQISPEAAISVFRIARVPIKFRVTDDVGLQAVQFHWEISGRKPKQIEIPLASGAREVQVSWELICADHRLEAGDSILYHVSATDIPPAEGGLGQQATSEVGIIEIRPDRQGWLLMPAPPAQAPGPQAHSLLDVLAHTRALLKKTWNAAQGPSDSPQAQAAVEALYNDAQFCRSTVEMNRDHPGQGFSAAKRAKLTLISKRYKKAEHELHSMRPGQALKPLKQAYQLLRNFVDERILIYRPPSPGQAPEEKQPEKIRLVPTLALSAKQIQADQQQAQQTLADLQQQQIRLNEAMERLLQERSGSPTASGDPGESQASTQAQLDMLRARQHAIRQETARIRAGLEETRHSAGDHDVPSEAEQHLAQALSQMQAVEEHWAQLPGQSNREQEAMSQALLSQIEAVQQQLQQSSRALDTASTQAADRRAQQARDMAQALSQWAQAWEQETSTASRETQLERLQQAQGLLRSLGPPQELFMGPGSRGGDRMPLVLTRDAGAGPAQIAWDLAGRFWSLSLKGQQQNTRPAPAEPSDIEFFSLEQAFFQRVAEYRPDTSEP